MTAQPLDPTAGAMWAPDPIRQRLASYTIAYELIGDAYELVADSTEEIVLEKPFDIRLPIRDIAP